MTTDKIIALLGGGNMAEALTGGLIEAGVPSTRIHVSDPSQARREQLQQRFAVHTFEENRRATQEAGIIILAVKPNLVTPVLEGVRGILPRDSLVISIAAGVPMKRMTPHLPDGHALIRAMPNTPALIRAGITALFPGDTVTALQLQEAQALFATAGEVVVVEKEDQLDAVTALSGSGPAYVFLMAEALSDGGVACGLPRAIADRLAVATLSGSAQMIAATGKHPGVLKNQVTSPGGTTIAGLAVLEKAGVRGTLMAAVEAAWKRSCKLGS